MKKLTLLFTIIALMMSSSAFAQKTWTGTTSTAWNTAGNWSPSGIPTASDNVTIPSAPANQPLISGTASPVCNNLTVNSGATLTISGTSLANAQLTVAGTATFNGALSIGGGVAKTGKIVATNVVWNSTSTLLDFINARFEVSGNWTFSTGSSIDMGYCWLTFTGTGNSTITNNSANSKFSSLTLGKTATATTYIGATSTATLTVTSGLNINASNTLYGSANITTILQANVVSNGLFKFDYGTVSLERASGTQQIDLLTTGNYFNSLKINGGATVTINNSLSVMGDLTIQSGTFNPQNNTLYVTGNWINTAGPAYFMEGTGKVVFNVIINKDGGRDYDQVIQNAENFNILELNNNYGDLIINSGLVVVTCNQYDWVAGGINVSQGVFTALDLVDNGLFGRYTVSGTGTINLTNTGGYVDLSGNINISGGTMNVYGGTTESYWPYNTNASITMSNGILNFADQGIRVSATTLTLTSNITGGTIKTAKNFGNYRADFNPTGGTIEMYGPTDASLYCVGTAALYGLKINKTASKDGENSSIIYHRIDRETGEELTDETRAQIVNLTAPVTLNGNFTLTSGTFNSNSHTIQAKRDWTNNAGAGSFNPGTGRVIFNGGNYHQICYNETFNILEVAKASGGSFRINSGAVTCAQYDWTIGSIDVITGTFTANDLYENGLYGGFYVNPGGTINLYQDIYQYIDLNGGMTFTNGGTINVYGGNGNSQWALGANASLTMNGGTLDFKDWGITLTTLSPNTITENITGGTIRTTGGFFCNRTDFTPTGGTIELYGTQNTLISQSAGSLFNLNINKAIANSVSLSTNVTLSGGLTVNSGTLNVNAKTLTTGNASAVNNGGVLHLNAGSTLLIPGTYYLNVNSGGLFKAIGTAANPALISRNGASGYIYINIIMGGNISARNTRFHYLNPLTINPGADIDPDNPFDDCQFRYCATGMLKVDNQQTLLIRNTEFLTPATGYNVYKSANSGGLTFKDAFGNYSGAAYENDPYNRIAWTVTQPGLWTGAVSTNWNTAGNWDDNAVPTAATNVTIPTGVTNMPLIVTNVQCNNLTLNGTLTINGAILTVNGNATIAGNLTLNSEGSRFVVMGDLTWNTGSTANMNHIDTEIHIYGNYTYMAGSNVQLTNGTVRFRGTVNKNITNHSATSSFFNLNSYKTSGAAIDFSSTSTQPLRVNGTLSTETGAKFTSSSSLNIELMKNLVSYGTFQLAWPRLVLKGNNQFIQPNVNDSFYLLDFNQSGTATINTTNSNVLNVRGGISILSGVFNAGSSSIRLGSGWYRQAGTFVPGNSRIIFDGAGVQELYSDENFNILEINKSSGEILVNSTVVTCNSFDWTNGKVKLANGGIFTANDLADDGIFGNFDLQSGSTVNLHQDIYQRVDFGGNLAISGLSTVNVYGGNGWSQWPFGANALLYMTDGTLDFKDQGINVNFMSPNTLTLDLTGGTIRTAVGFFCNRADFDPEPATLEIYGAGSSSIDLQSGHLWDININKTGTEDEVLINDDLTANSVIVNSGVLKSTPNSNLIFKDAYANDNGTIWLTEGTDIKLIGTYEFGANGGKFMFMGEPDNYVSVGRQGTNYANLYVGNGGNISARYTHFSDLSGALIMNDGIVNPDHAFTGCTFENGFYCLMQIDNNQDLTIQNAHFPTASAPYNVTKQLNQGSVTFINATGAFAGEAFEDDPYNRIHWVIPQPGLWTGAVSIDWHLAENWDDGLVPTTTTDVTIPVSTPNMPIIYGVNAICRNININGTLTIGLANLDVIGNFAINGNLEMNPDWGRLTVQGDINWNEGSTADFTENTRVIAYGNWNFNAGANVQMNNGTVYFEGTTNKWIRCHSAECSFFTLASEKTGGAYIGFSDISTQSLVINDDLVVFSDAKFISDSDQDIVVKGSLTSNGIFQCNLGAIKLNGIDQNIGLNVNDYLNNVVFNQSGTTALTSSNADSLIVKGNLSIRSGILEPNDVTILIAGDWSNSAGSNGFNESWSTVKFNGDGNVQRIYNDENFETLVLNKTSSGSVLEIQANVDVHCNNYNWNAGGLSVVSGSFTAENLLGPIGGDVGLYPGGTITMGNSNSSTDLVGRLFIHGGTFNILTSTESQWPGSGNAQLSMSGGVLNVYPGGIKIVDNPPFMFVNDITGGIIRTEGNFYNERSDFTPIGGIVELYGAENTSLVMNDGTFCNLNISKAINKSVTMNSNVYASNNVNIQSGKFQYTNQILAVVNDVNVAGQAMFSLDTNSALYLYPESDFTISEGAIFSSTGTIAQPNLISTFGSGVYNLEVSSGGTISALSTYFYFFSTINITSTGLIDPSNAFQNCGFYANQGPALAINNNQDIRIFGAIFPYAMTVNRNVSKTVNVGKVTMIDATGDGAGAIYENDPYNRIDWRASQPGLWTGAVSTDWHTAANWDDFNVPDESIDVLVPESVSSMNMPVINNNAICKNLLNYGQLTIQDQTLTVNEKLILFGHLNINKTVVVEGDFWCQEGSSATGAATSLITCKGDLFFAAGSDVQLNNGVVRFSGDDNSIIKNNSITSYFNEIQCEKNSGAVVSFDASSGLPLRINGNLSITDGSGFISTSGQNIILKGHLISEGTFQCESGTFILNGNYHIITMSMNNYFHNLDFSMTGSASFTDIFSNTLTIKNDLIINSGVFSGGSTIISVGRDWKNNAGSGSFVAQQSKVIFDGNDPGENQFIYGGGSFNIIELRQHSDAKLTINDGAATICNKYDWTSGTLEIVNGVFNSYDLLDDRIAGNWILHNDGSIYLYDESTMGLGGNVTIYGGVFSVAGGQQYFSYWPSVSDASLVMSGGILEYNNQSIKIVENASCSFTSNITGGIIKTTGWFQAEHPGFDPTGGTVEIYGETDGYVGSGNGSEFYNLRINKSTISPAVGMQNAVVKKALTVDGGRINIMDGDNLTCMETVNLNNGWLEIYYGGTLKMGNFSALNVAEGSQLRTYGLPENRSLITGITPSSYYQITVADGGWISMKHTIIENLDETGLFIYNNAEVDVDNAFNGCIFRNGKSCNNALITINTNQDLVSENVEFDNVSKSRLYNVAKWVNSGSITFENYSGSFAGSAFEDDPYGRILWDNPQPGLWTGAISTDWFTAGNWDDLLIPTSSTNVTIPAEKMNMPVIATGTADCNNMTLNGTLTVGNATLNIAGDLAVNGNLTTTNLSGKIIIHGDANWNSGATASMFMNSAIWIYGNWNFNEGSNVQLDNGTVFFMGNTTKTLSNYSPNSMFGGLFIYKTGGAYVELTGASNHPLTVNAALRIDNGSQLIINSDEHLSLRAHLYIDGNLQCNSGTIKFSGINSNIKCSSDDYFNHVIFDQSGTASLYDSFSEFNIKGDLTINSGIFNPAGNTIKIQGSWYNTAGPDHFSEANSRVIFNGSTPQFCSTEEFYILEIDKPLHYFYDQSESNISCQIYDWTQGGMWIAGGSTFHAADLADDGIFGDFVLWWNSIELHQDASQSIDLHGSISVNGGEFKVYGGNDQSLWGTNANASLYMGSGILDFVDQGIKIQDAAPYSFTSTISGGTIRTQKGFVVQSPGFDPMGGTVELYGPQNSAILSTEGGAFYNVTINKPTDFSTRATIWPSIVKNNFVVAEGLAEVGFGHELECWTNLEVQDGGWLAVNSATISMKYLSSVNVYDNGALSIFGYEGAMSRVKGILPTEPYTFSINNGGTLEATFTIFETLPEQGVYIAPGGIVNPAYPFTNCEFRNGMSGPTTLMSIDSDQDIIIENAVFPTNTWGGQYNVRKIFDSGSVTFINATGAFAGSDFENDPFNRIFWGDEFAAHDITIPAGWSGLSSFVIPTQPAMEDVFAPIMNNLVIAQTMTEMFYPAQNINTIGNWESHSAYKVKTTGNCILHLTGDYETDMTVSLNAGWSLLPVVTPDGGYAEDLLSSVGGFVIAKEVAGSKVFWPEYGINSLEYLFPGKAYYVLLTENGEVDYAGLKSTFTRRENLSLSPDLTAFNIQATPITHTIAILPEALKDFEPGTVIGAYDQDGNCFGITETSRENNYMTVFGDDPTTGEKDGFFEGDMMFFQTLSMLSGLPTLTGLNATFDISLPQSDSHFTENGLSAIIEFKSATGVGFLDFGRLVNIFPNPSDGVVNITGLQSGAKITVTDVQGQIVLVVGTETAGQTSVDLTGHNAGVYFIKIKQNGQNVFRKIILR